MSNYEPLRVAIVGCGNISNAYARSLKTKPQNALQRCTALQALHVLETCLGILQSAEEGRPIAIESRFIPPAPLEQGRR